MDGSRLLRYALTMRLLVGLLFVCVSLAVMYRMIFAPSAAPVELRLSAPEPQSSEGFGNAVAVGPEDIFVGAWTYARSASEPKTGRVQVFTLAEGTWLATQELTPRAPRANQSFGASLALDGDTLFVGAPGQFGAKLTEAEAKINLGSVFVFERIDGRWQETAEMRAQGGASGDCFGYSIALEGRRAVIGAIGRGVALKNAGAAYIFELSDGAWRETQVLGASDASSGALFGHSVGLSGGTALVGAHRERSGSTRRRGAAYIFELNAQASPAAAWIETAKLLAPGPLSKGRLGHCLDLEDGLAVIAERMRPPSGAVHVFTKGASSWSLSATLNSPSPDAGEFGWSVDLNGGEILVGDRRDSGDELRAGAAFRFARDEAGAWQLLEMLRSTNPSPNGEFGLSVALGFGRAVVGAWAEDSEVSNSGAAHVFERR